MVLMRHGHISSRPGGIVAQWSPEDPLRVQPFLSKAGQHLRICDNMWLIDLIQTDRILIDALF